MGIHRNLIHPKFGNFILLGTVLLDQDLQAYDAPIDYNPCLECKLCVAACPVGAIKHDGEFDFQACFTHNYREFMGGFTDWVEQIADSSDALDYRRRVNEPETADARAGMTLLEVAEEADVVIDNDCRSGSCGSCRVKLVSGEVHMSVVDALSEDEREEGYDLACQAKLRGDVQVEA